MTALRPYLIFNYTTLKARDHILSLCVSLTVSGTSKKKTLSSDNLPEYPTQENSSLLLNAQAIIVPLLGAYHNAPCSLLICVLSPYLYG